MAVTQISRIQHRRGLRIDLPDPLNDAEFGWAQDTRELYIGNGIPFLGNTQILTEISPAILPPYTYISHTETDAVTGVDPFGDLTLPDANFPTIRTYQEKFDDFVNARDYGVVGNGTVDDAGALIRAMRDLYDEASGPLDTRRKRALYIPAGIYIISQAIPLYPFCNLIGDGKGRTIIKLDFTLGPVSAFTSNDCVARTVDSLGQSALNIGDDPGAGFPQYRLPQNIRVSGITFESNTPTNTVSGFKSEGASKKEIVKLDLAKNVRFDDCEFKGIWNLMDSNIIDGSVGVLISKLIGAPAFSIAQMKGYTFRGCSFTNLVHGFNVLDTISDVNVLDCDFEVMYNPIKIGFNPALDMLVGSYVDAPELFRVSYSRFTDYEGIGFDVRSSGKGNISSYNHYAESTTAEPAIRFDDPTEGCVSIGDTFDDGITSFDCVDKSMNLRVRNLSVSNTNVVMNAQDPFEIPFGFCGNILIEGDLTVTGDLILGGNIISTSVPVFAVFDVTTIATIPFTDGNIIHFEYGMNLTNTIYRSGTMKIAHDGDGTTAVPTTITFDDTFTEVGGPPGNSIILSVAIVDPNIEVQVTTVLGPSFNSTYRALTV